MSLNVESVASVDLPWPVLVKYYSLADFDPVIKESRTYFKIYG